MGMAFLHLTLLYSTSGEWQHALDNGAQSAEIFNNIGTRDSLLGLYVTMGRAWLGNGNMDKADEFVRQAQAIYEELGGEESGRVDDYARLVYLMAEIALARGLFEQASFYYQRSMNLFEHTGDRLQRGRALLRLAEVAVRLGVLGEAREWLLEAKNILEHTSTSQDLQQLQIISSQL
jgi:tetratricopeptide (TPR) repeat protein